MKTTKRKILQKIIWNKHDGKSRAEEIVFDVDKQERQELFNEFEIFMTNRKTHIIRSYLAIAEYCIYKDNLITNQKGKIIYPRGKK